MTGHRASRISGMTRTALFALTLTVAALTACDLGDNRTDSLERTTAPEKDAAMALAELGVAPGPALASIRRHPESSGTFGREGLRITAVYRVSPEQAAAVAGKQADGWRTAPLPAIAQRFDQGPKELAVYPQGAYTRCSVWFTDAGKAVPCDDRAFVAAFDKNPTACRHYRAAVLDRNAGTLIIVYKNYY